MIQLNEFGLFDDAVKSFFQFPQDGHGEHNYSANFLVIYPVFSGESHEAFNEIDFHSSHRMESPYALYHIWFQLLQLGGFIPVYADDPYTICPSVGEFRRRMRKAFLTDDYAAYVTEEEVYASLEGKEFPYRPRVADDIRLFDAVERTSKELSSLLEDKTTVYLAVFSILDDVDEENPQPDWIIQVGPEVKQGTEAARRVWRALFILTGLMPITDYEIPTHNASFEEWRQMVRKEFGFDSLPEDHFLNEYAIS